MATQVEHYRELRKSKEILYTHCRNCLSDKPVGMSPEDWADLEVIIVKAEGFVIIGCRRCEMPIFAAVLAEDVAERIKDCGCAECRDKSKMN